MKIFKMLFVLTILSFSFLFVSCKKEDNETKTKEPTITNKPTEETPVKEKNFNFDNLKEELFVGESLDLTYSGDILNLSELEITVTGDAISLDGLKLSAIKAGSSSIKVLIKETNQEFNFNIIILDAPEISLIGDNTINIGEKKTLSILLKNAKAEASELTWTSSDENVLKVKNGEIEAKGSGTATITVSYKGYSASMEITVLSLVTSIEFSVTYVELEVGDTYNLLYEVKPSSLNPEVEFSSSDPSVVSVDDKGFITALEAGEVTITVKALDGSEESGSMKVNVLDTEKPTVSFTKGEDIKLGYGEELKPLDGVVVMDNLDGDITENVEIVTNDVNNKKYGTYTLTFRVSDSSGNKLTFRRNVTVYWQYDVMFIGHAGSFYGAMNSEQAIMYAADVLHYQAIEIDLAQTSDGVFVLSHDAKFGDYTIASTSWSTFENYTVSIGRSSGIPASDGSVTGSPYQTKLCTLARYLDICKEYGIKAVIELKSSKGIQSSDTSRMPDLMAEIKAHGMLDDVIFLASQTGVLQWVRNNGYDDIECQYLVNSADSQSVLDFCIKWNCDLSTNVTYGGTNSPEWLAKYHEAGLKISTYTFTQYVDYPEVQKWIDAGVDYLTCDWQIMEKLKLPVKDTTPKPTFTVTFKDYDGTVLKEAKVVQGKTAASPTVNDRLGYAFKGWDQPITNVQSDMEVTAQYEIITYGISYKGNNSVITESSWASKDEFVNEIYSDLYDFFKEKGANLEGVTVSGDKITITKNGVTVSFSNITELLAIDIYDFEKTVSNYFYLPVTRNSDDSCEILPDESYFLNSSKYLEKYRAFDPYLINCINTRYTSYDKTYKPLSSGKIQIFFRFHQWAKGTNIAEFNTLPVKYIVEEGDSSTITLPTDHLSYTVEDEFDLPVATLEGKTFGGWFLDKECTKPLNKITKGSTGSIVLYAKWD